MGLLDDAIREHLELRRLHGADPSEVAGKEHEALGQTMASGGGMPPAETGPTFTAKRATTGESRRAVRWEDAWDADSSHLNQETVELDMRAVLEEDSSGRIARAMPDELPGDGEYGSGAGAPLSLYR
jgi:hypothetical protein